MDFQQLSLIINKHYYSDSYWVTNYSFLSQSNWRAKHEEFISNLRAARGVTAAQKTGGPLPPPPPPATNPDYVQCPHCSRRFNEHAAERHIPFCKEQKSRLANASSAKSGSLAKRKQVICNLQISVHSTLLVCSTDENESTQRRSSFSQSVIMLNLWCLQTCKVSALKCFSSISFQQYKPPLPGKKSSTGSATPILSATKARQASLKATAELDHSSPGQGTGRRLLIDLPLCSHNSCYISL